jgi:hypothetical protein
MKGQNTTNKIILAQAMPLRDTNQKFMFAHKEFTGGCGKNINF